MVCPSIAGEVLRGDEDVALRRGVWADASMTDKETGRGLAVRVLFGETVRADGTSEGVNVWLLRSSQVMALDKDKQALAVDDAHTPLHGRR